MKKHLESYGTIEKYYFDKRIFRIAFLLLFIILIVMIADNNFQLGNEFYMECPEYEPYCYNPFYNYNPCPQLNFCDQEILKGGESIGIKPKPYFTIYTGLLLLLLSFAFIINHIMHNGRNK